MLKCNMEEAITEIKFGKWMIFTGEWRIYKTN
jgi:hypothetical protein